MFRIDTGEFGSESCANHLMCQVRRGNTPQRKERVKMSLRELPFPVLADILQEKITKSNRLNERLTVRIPKGLGDSHDLVHPPAPDKKGVA